jgi:hypothetical protein
MVLKGFGGVEPLCLALARFVARVGLVDHVDTALAAHDLAVGVTLLRGFDRGDDFHKKEEHTGSPPVLSNGISLMHRLS